MTTKTRPWPHGCSHPNSCEKYTQCSYINCRHESVDILPAILQLQKYRAEIERNQKQATTLEPATLAPMINDQPMAWVIKGLYAFAREGVSIGDTDPMEILIKTADRLGYADLDNMLHTFGIES